jgi:hypothetical protein
MSYLSKFKQKLDAASLPKQIEQSYPQVSEKVVNLAHQLDVWHDARPVPERWNPVQLGRLAATLGVSNELIAAALQYAGWTERKQSTYSLWVAPIR